MGIQLLEHADDCIAKQRLCIGRAEVFHCARVADVLHLEQQTRYMPAFVGEVRSLCDWRRRDDGERLRALHGGRRRRRRRGRRRCGYGYLHTHAESCGGLLPRVHVGTCGVYYTQAHVCGRSGGEASASRRRVDVYSPIPLMQHHSALEQHTSSPLTESPCFALQIPTMSNR